MKHARIDYDRIQDPENKIPADEPVFLLRAQDRTAASTLQFWILANQALEDCDPRAVELAQQHQEKMKAWPTKKTADIPKTPVPVPDNGLSKLKAMCTLWEHVGSRVTCCPVPANSDLDILALTKVNFDGFLTACRMAGFKQSGSKIEVGASGMRFASVHRPSDNVNIIATDTVGYADRFMVATRIATTLNLQDKAQRVLLFDAIIHGKG